jgi:hypothetical protein
VAPTLKWGLGLGIVVALVDTLSAFLARGHPPESDLAQYIALADQLANVVLFSIVGVRVGRETGIARAAAEAGVLAGVIAGAVAVSIPYVLPGAPFSPSTSRDVVGTLALNVAMGGLLALLNGWLVTRSDASRQGRRG